MSEHPRGAEMRERFPLPRKHAPARADYPHRFPCPWCKGAGGHTEGVPGCWEDGPRYDCDGCGGSGDGRDFVRIRDEREARYLVERLVMCRGCGHHALDHYAGTDRCAWMSDESDVEGRLAFCECALSRESVLAHESAVPA